MEFWTKTIRKELGMTQEAFAEAVGITVFAVRTWEQGLKKPSRRTINKINQMKEKSGKMG